jgi:hypothetical protein
MKNKKYLAISNKGEIETEALYLLGITDKRDVKGKNVKNKIGYFGTGIKYALAYLLRNDFNINIYSGLKNIHTSTIDKSFRNIDYKLILIDDIETSITTLMGADWSLWQAIREIYCNAIDEGDSTCYVCDNKEDVLPIRKGYTTFLIELNDELNEICSNWDKYFSVNTHAKYRNEYGAILSSSREGNVRIYRHGILCYNNESLSSLYDYEFDLLKIGEDRLADYFDILSILSLFYEKCNDVNIIKNFIEASTNSKFIESKVNMSGLNLLSEWKEALIGKTIVPYEYSGFYASNSNCVYLNLGLYISLYGKYYNELNFVHDPFQDKPKNLDITGLSEEQNNNLTKVLTLFINSNYKLRIKKIIAIKSPDSKYFYIDRNNAILYSNIKSFNSQFDLANIIISANTYYKNNLSHKNEIFVNSIIFELIKSMEINTNISLDY